MMNKHCYLLSVLLISSPKKECDFKPMEQVNRGTMNKTKTLVIVSITAIFLHSCTLFTKTISHKDDGSNQPFSFGVIADCQYCNVKGEGVRKYSQSANKLEKCVAHLNTLDLEYVVHLGDFIDRDFSSFDVVAPIYDQLLMPKYHVLGNHDFSVIDEKKNDVPRKMGLRSRYYDFEVNGWRFVVLDGNDMSFYAHPESSQKYQESAEYCVRNQIDSPIWNGGVGDKQLSWLKKVLEKATRKKEQVVLYCHFPIFPEDIHNLWNADEVVKTIESYPCVKAYMNGHNHKGNYGIKDGIHYLTLQGMVDTEETSYAVISVAKDKLVLKGYGREEDRIMELNR